MTTDINDMHLKEYAFAETKRHKPCLIYRGYRYVQDKIQNRTIYWRCEDRSHCNGRAHQLLGNDSLPILTIQHNHSPTIEDLARHDIISVDSHRRRRRQQQQQTRRILPHYSNDLLFSSNMNSIVKRETNPNKQQRLQQHAAIVKNLHLSEVITTTAAPHSPSYNNTMTNRQTTMDPREMTKLLSNITTIATKSSLKPTSTSPTMDYPSRLNHFSWEEIEGRYLPVIYRNENDAYQRYTSKMYVENTVLQSEVWQHHTNLARSLPPIVSYAYTEHELKLFRMIISWHLAGFYFKTIPSNDCLIRFEDLWDFYSTLRKLRDTVSTTTTTLNRSIAPSPVSEVPKPAKESGWVQINNVFVPYIIKIKLRDNHSSKCPTRQSTSQIQREFYVPYEILIKCHIFSDQEFSFKKFLIKATQQDFDILNNLITNINIFDEKVPEKTFLVNLYHVMVGLNRILYIKFLPTKQPRTQVNKYHADILTHKGGTLLMNGNKLIPYIVQNNRFYVPLLYTFHSLPNILAQAKRGARAPRQHEIDYLNLLFIYFSIDIPPLTSDTLLVDIFNVKCSNLQTPIHFRTLHEHQQHERTKLVNTLARTTAASKTSAGSSTTTKTSKCPPANVVVNPMIHHPSFYGLASPKPPVFSPMRHPEIKSIDFDQYSFNAIVKSADQSNHDWKISIKEIFQQFSFDIDYQKFIQWCQMNLLLPLVKLDEQESKIVQNVQQDEYFIYQHHLDRCVELLKDLQRGTISMTLLPPENHESQQTMVRSPLAGAKKRKTTVPITRHMPSVSTTNAASPELPLPEESSSEVSNEIPLESSNDPMIDVDDDMMPVVASVEEEQPLEDSAQPVIDPTFVIVESADCNDERIQLDDRIPSCSSDDESSVVLNPVHSGEEEETCSREPSPFCPSTVPPSSPKKLIKKRPRNGYGRSRARARSMASRMAKKPRLIDENDDEHASLVIVITSDKIEQHLRTLFMATNDPRRTRTRPVKTPTRLVEEIHLNHNNNNSKTLEPETNVFDILSSPTTTADAMNSNELTENSQQTCTYNVVISTKPNKLGLTIKKVVPP